MPIQTPRFTLNILYSYSITIHTLIIRDDKEMNKAIKLKSASQLLLSGIEYGEATYYSLGEGLKGRRCGD